MIIIRNTDRPASLSGPVIACLGNFDGLHCGHQKLFLAALKKKQELAAGTIVAVSFYPHPSKVLRGSSGPLLLTTTRQKVEILSTFGIDALYLIHFTKKLSQLSVNSFIDSELIQKLNVQHLILGPDARVGHNREGTPEVISEKMKSAGRTTEIVPFLELDNERISSKRVRATIAEGNFELATQLLGRRYALQNRVVHGAGRGRLLGVRTLNLKPQGRVIPPFGVYATWVTVKGVRHAAVTNIGVRPTFGSNEPLIESHLLETTIPDAYRELVSVEFVKFIRPEQKFASAELLQQQIRRDCGVAMEILKFSA